VRYQHFLAKAKGDAMPRSIVAVACETEEWTEPGSPGIMRRRLKSWHAKATLLDRGRPGAEHHSSGVSTQSFWESLGWLLVRGGVTWIISCPAGLTWTLLDVWERLENGTLRITGCDTRACPVRPGGLPGLPVPRPAGDAGAGGGTSYGLPGMRQGATDSSKRLSYDSPKRYQDASTGYIVLEDPPSVLHARVAGTTGTIHWVDSRNYGVTCDEPEETAADRATGLHRFALDMCDTLRQRGLGGLRDTAGSQAMASFRRKHISHLVLCHTVSGALRLEAASLYGGRCEVGKMGTVDGPIYHYDFRSLYPYVCASQALPVRLRRFTDRDCDPATLGEEVLGTSIARATVESQEPVYPYRRDGLVLYPVGRYATTLCGPELLDGYRRGRIRSITALASYDLAPALANYAREVDQIRSAAESTGNRHLERWAKLLGVCLPGKLAQRERGWSQIDCSPPFGWYAEWHQLRTGERPERWRTIAGVTQCEHVGAWHNDAVPAMAAWITSAARMRLWEAIRCAGLRNVYYWDTDSLFVNSAGVVNLHANGWVRDGKMGYLQLKGSYSTMEIRGIKDYTVDGRHVCAGLSKGHTDYNLAPDACWWTPPVTRHLRAHAMPVADSVLRRYQRVNPYRHGSIGVDGWVEPLQVWE